MRSTRAREDELPEDLREAGSGKAPINALLEREAREVLEQAMGHLPAEQRAVFVLRTAEELSYKEIAEALNISIGTVMSRLARAREKLRVALGSYLTSAGNTAAEGNS